MKVNIIVCVILFSFHLLPAQNIPVKEEGYCESSWCKLRPDHPAHFDPYYNAHLCENFNPKQNDFSAEYLKLQRSSGGRNVVRDLLTFDLSPIWVTHDGMQNGIIGLDYKRIRIHISQTTKDPTDKLLYHVKGKSNVSGNICDFSGEIRLIEAYAAEDGEHENSGTLFARYNFNEDSTQRHVGTFQGVVECYYFLDQKTKKGFLDESSDVADGYHNRTYVGTWKGYQASISKKCIWGDYRLPFTFDFDCGDGIMIVCDQYVKNGWVSFNDGSEFSVIGEKVVLKDKWWTTK